MRSRLAALVLCCLLLPPRLATAARAPAVDIAALEEVRATGQFTRGEPLQPSLTPDGRTVWFLRSGPRDEVQELFVHDVDSGIETRVLAADDLGAPRQGKVSESDWNRRQRLRDLSEGITGYERFGDDDRLLVPYRGWLFMVRRSTGEITRLPGEDWIDPQLSPDEEYVAAVRGRELHVIELATNHVTTLTRGASATISHGLADFLAQEEMKRFSGFWWSPDGTTLAYQETDESGVELHVIETPRTRGGRKTLQPYPRAGTALPRVRLWLVPRAGGERREVRWDATSFPYLARVLWWHPSAPLTLVVQNRAQTELLILAVDATTGATREIFRETDPAWVNLDDQSYMPVWCGRGDMFLWTTERRGAWQLEMRAQDGSLLHEITPVDLAYAGLLGTAANGAWRVRATTDPRAMHVWQFPRLGGPGRALTSGMAMNSFGWTVDQGRKLRSVEGLDGVTVIDVVDSRNRVITTLRSVAARPTQPPRVELTQTNSVPVCDVAIVRPHDFVAGRSYPVLLEVYGGPGHKMVTADGSTYQDAQVYANDGYIVVRIDGRGTPLRGRAWDRVLQGNLIDAPLDDQVRALQELGERYPELDLARVGIWGWSYGGYVTAMAVLRRPDVFHCGVAIAPVVKWEDYDTHYTERYLGLPAERPEAYRRSNVTSYAEELVRPLLIAHGVEDDNVHFTHSLELVSALKKGRRHADLLRFDGTHLASNLPEQVRLDRKTLEFFRRHLQSARPPAFRPAPPPPPAAEDSAVKS